MGDIIDLNKLLPRTRREESTPPARKLALILGYLAFDIRAAGHNLAADLVLMAAEELVEAEGKMPDQAE